VTLLVVKSPAIRAAAEQEDHHSDGDAAARQVLRLGQ
jgi:hypothetical protein